MLTRRFNEWIPTPVQDGSAHAARTQVRTDGRAYQLDGHRGRVQVRDLRRASGPGTPLDIGLIVWRIESRSIGRSRMSSIRRSRAFDRVRTCWRIRASR